MTGDIGHGVDSFRYNVNHKINLYIHKKKRRDAVVYKIKNSVGRKVKLVEQEGKNI